MRLSVCRGEVGGREGDEKRRCPPACLLTLAAWSRSIVTPLAPLSILLWVEYGSRDLTAGGQNNFL